MRESTCQVERWSQFHKRDEKQAMALLARKGRGRLADQLRNKAIPFDPCQPTGVFCDEGLTLRAIGVPTPVRLSRGCLALIITTDDAGGAPRALGLVFPIVRDQIAQLGAAFESGRPLERSKLVVGVRTAEFPPVNGARAVEGAAELLRLLEGDFGMRHIDMPKARASRGGARRYRYAYRFITAERAAETYPTLPPTRPAPPAPHRDPEAEQAPKPAPAGDPAAMSAALPAVRAETVAPVPVVSPTGQPIAETELKIKVGLGTGIFGYTFAGELTHTRRLRLPGGPRDADDEIDDDEIKG